MVFDPRVPSFAECVLPYQLEHWAKERADQVAVIFYGGETWTWAHTLQMTRRGGSGGGAPLPMKPMSSGSQGLRCGERGEPPAS